MANWRVLTKIDQLTNPLNSYRETKHKKTKLKYSKGELKTIEENLKGDFTVIYRNYKRREVNKMEQFGTSCFGAT